MDFNINSVRRRKFSFDFPIMPSAGTYSLHTSWIYLCC